MIDDSERREIAARLRESREFISSLPKTTPEKNVFDTFELILTCIGYEAGNLFDYLAKLIDRPTCKPVIPNEIEGCVFCPQCGAEIGEYVVPNYCYNCGMEIEHD